jgi:hypothetical protein
LIRGGVHGSNYPFNPIRSLSSAHKLELRELFYMLNRQERLEVEGSPAIPPPDDVFPLEDDENENYEQFLSTYALTR